MKRADIAASALSIGVAILCANKAFSQTAQQQIGTAGQLGTATQSITTGTSTSLSFGSSSTIGVSANISATSGTRVLNNADLGINNQGSGACSTGGCLQTTLGVGDENGRLTAGISTVRETTITNSGNTRLETLSSLGQSSVSGIQSVNSLSMDGTKSFLSIELEKSANSQGSEALSLENEIGNGSASINSNTNINVQINNSTFTSVFQQAY